MASDRERIDKAIAWLSTHRQEVESRLPARLRAVTYKPECLPVLDQWAQDWKDGGCPSNLALAYIHRPIRALYQIWSHEK